MKKKKLILPPFPDLISTTTGIWEIIRKTERNCLYVSIPGKQQFKSWWTKYKSHVSIHFCASSTCEPATLSSLSPVPREMKKLIILSELGNPFYFTSRRLTCNISLQWEHIILINKWQKQRNSLLWQSCLDMSSNSPNWLTRKYEEANKENYSVIRYWNLTQRIAIG